jgi:hypothetical protein
MTMSAAFPMSDRHAQLIWFDPGETTGVVVLAVRPSWLAGEGNPTWEGLGRKITARWFGQIGRDARIVDAHGRAKKAAGKVVKSPTGQALGRPPTSTMAQEIEMVRECEALLDLWQEAAWGYEGYVARAGNSMLSHEAWAPVRVFSRLEYVEMVYGARQRVPFVQLSSMAKTTATDDRLKAAGLYQPGMSHATDAARHAATFLRAARNDSELRALAWPRLFKSAAA